MGILSCLAHLLIILFLFQLFQQLDASFIACDCNDISTKGILNYDELDICKKGSEIKNIKIPVTYHLITKRKPSINFKGFMCEKWIKTLKITGSFWLGDFDTEHLQTTKRVEPQECWDMIRNLNCNGNKMIKDEKTFSFLQQPYGEGKWYATKEYTVANCLAREIELTQENPNDNIESPFGKLTDDAKKEYSIINKQTIIWNLPSDYSDYKTSCEPTSIFKGSGEAIGGENETIAKIIDRQNQIEVIYHTATMNYCNDIDIYEVKGVPDTFIRIRFYPNNVKESLNKNKNSSTRNFLIRTKRFDYGSEKLGYNPELQGFKIIFQNDSKAVGLIRSEDNCISTNDGSPLPIVYPCLKGKLDLNNHIFEYYSDLTIRKFNTTICLSTEFTLFNKLIIQDCSINKLKWYINPKIKRFYAFLITDKTKIKCLSFNFGEFLFENCKVNNRNQIFEFAPPLYPYFFENSIINISKSMSTNNFPFNLNESSYFSNLEVKSDLYLDNKPNLVNTYIRPQLNSTKFNLNISGNDNFKQLLKPLHNQFKEGNMINDENKLANEINQIFCALQENKKIQAITLSQINGILAANIVGLNNCSRLQGYGNSLILQQCKMIPVNITAIETKCGFQPHFTIFNKEFTIGTDGWSIHPYHECFWKSIFVNINGKFYSWIVNETHNNWIEQIPKIHISNLHIISNFKEILVNDYDFQLQYHSSHEFNLFENLNIVNDLANRIQNQNSDIMPPINVSSSMSNQISFWSSWTKILKIVVFSIIFLLLILILIKLIRFFKFCKFKRNYSLTTNHDHIALHTPITENHLINNHSHLICKYTPNVGITWEDGCAFES